MGWIVCIENSKLCISSCHNYFHNTDIDQCLLLTHDCEQICVNTIKGFNCSCTDGYMLANDSRSCEGMPVYPFRSRLWVAKGQEGGRGGLSSIWDVATGDFRMFATEGEAYCIPCSAFLQSPVVSQLWSGLPSIANCQKFFCIGGWCIGFKMQTK